jgi:hypothetical protein
MGCRSPWPMRHGRVGVRKGGWELRRLGSPAPEERVVDGGVQQAKDSTAVEQRRGGQEDERVCGVS